MPLFATTVIMLGQTAQGMGVYPRTYVTEAKTAGEATDVAGKAEVKAHPNRLFYDSATERVPNAVVREAARGGEREAGTSPGTSPGTVNVTGVVLSYQTDAGTAMKAFSHASAKGAGEAKEAAVAAARKAHPDKMVVYADTIPTPPETVRKVALDLEARTAEVRSSRVVADQAVQPLEVSEFARNAINRFRQTALEVGAERARPVTVYAISQEAKASPGMSVTGAIKIASAAIDSYVERRREGISHVEARNSSAGEVARRFDGTGRNALQRGVTVREHEAAL